MKNDLPAFFTGVENQFVALEPPLARQFPSNPNEVTDQRFVLFRNVRNRRDMFFWNNENVDRRGRIDVVESDDASILILDGGGSPTVRDVAKNTGQI